VATSVGGIPQLVRHGRTGLLVPPRDPAALRAGIETLLTDPALGLRLGCAARSRVEALCSWDRIIDATLAAYGAPAPLAPPRRAPQLPPAAGVSRR
jgi:type III pantothenate kinase